MKLLAKHSYLDFTSEDDAWNFLESIGNFTRHETTVYPKKIGYVPTLVESDALSYLISQGWRHDQGHVGPEEERLDRERRLRTVHVIWLVGYVLKSRFKTEKISQKWVLPIAGKILGVDPETILLEMDGYHLNMVKAGPPSSWSPRDLLK